MTMFVDRMENGLAASVLAAMVVLATIEVVARAVGGVGVPGSIVLVQHLTLWVTVLGAMLAARSDRLLALSTPLLLPPDWRRGVRVGTSAMAAGVCAWLCAAGLELLRIERRGGEDVAWGIPSWIVLAVLPVGFGMIGARLAWRASDGWRGRAFAAAALAGPFVLPLLGVSGSQGVLGLAIALVGLAAFAGVPIFAAVAGIAMLLFVRDGTPITAVPAETVRLTTSPMLPAIPLFTLAGYLLAAGGASRRIMRVLSALVGWSSGGLAVVVTLVLAFFTPLTGASGITIVSMGGLLLPALRAAKYSESTAVGLVTVSGSIGLLFFPSLPVFLYAFTANVPFEQVFVAGLAPGGLLVLVVAGWAMWRGHREGVKRTPFQAREAVAAFWEAKWELLLPIVVLAALTSGWTTLIEAAAVSVVYVLVSECVIHNDLVPGRDLPRVLLECATLVGGFMIILSVALGLTQYLILADVPTRLLEWAGEAISSRAAFLLILNVFLLLVGAMMDIYSAIIVIAPLVIPLAAAYQVDPVHMAVIFLANMELGYLMPPMGENLFLSSYRFNRPLATIWRSTLPYTAVLLIAVLLITYVPALSLGLVRLAERVGYLH